MICVYHHSITLKLTKQSSLKVMKKSEEKHPKVYNGILAKYIFVPPILAKSRPGNLDFKNQSNENQDFLNSPRFKFRFPKYRK